MAIYISRGERTFGPYEDEELKSLLSAGNFTLQDLAWEEGIDEWRTLSDWPAFSASKTPPEPDDSVLATDPHPDVIRAYKIAYYQRRGIRAFMLPLGVCFLFFLSSLMPWLQYVVAILLIPSVIAMGYVIYCFIRLVSAMHTLFTKIILFILILLPGFFILEFFSVWFYCSKALKEAGIKVGPLGVSNEDLQQLKNNCGMI